jgi:hypothetical protein
MLIMDTKRKKREKERKGRKSRKGKEKEKRKKVSLPQPSVLKRGLPRYEGLASGSGSTGGYDKRPTRPWRAGGLDARESPGHGYRKGLRVDPCSPLS